MAGRGHGIRAVAGAVLAALAISGCQDRVEYHPRFPDRLRYRVSHMGTYAAHLEEENEVPGTIFEGALTYAWARDGAGWRVRRHLDSLDARGYHKKSMPNELERKIDLDLTLDAKRVPTRITGYDSIYRVLGRIDQKPQWRQQLLHAVDTNFLQAEMRDRFRLFNVLPEGRLVAPMEVPVAGPNAALETIKADSIRYQGSRPRLKRTCLEYSVYYHRSDSLPLLVEQFLGSSTKHWHLRHATWGPAAVRGDWHFAVDAKTGQGCFESRTESAEVVLKDKETKAETPVQTTRYEEEVYDY